jgi:hypothetical protein
VPALDPPRIGCPEPLRLRLFPRNFQIKFLNKKEFVKNFETGMD